MDPAASNVCTVTCELGKQGSDCCLLSVQRHSSNRSSVSALDQSNRI